MQCHVANRNRREMAIYKVGNITPPVYLKEVRWRIEMVHQLPLIYYRAKPEPYPVALLLFPPHHHYHPSLDPRPYMSILTSDTMYWWARQSHMQPTEHYTRIVYGPEL